MTSISLVDENTEQWRLLPYGTYVMVKVGMTFQLGYVISVDQDEEKITMQMMKKKGREEKPSFIWPDPVKEETFCFEDILSQVDVPSTKTGRLYYVTEKELEKVKEKLHR